MDEKRKIALCLPGAEFSSVWLAHVMQLQAHLLKEGYEVCAAYSYTNNIYITRKLIHEALMATPDLDYILWIDDDNVLTVPSVVRLIDDLDAHPEVDAVSGWYWLAADVMEGGRVSAGTLIDGLKMGYVSEDVLTKKSLVPIDWAGLGCCLMRPSALEKAGDRPFRPILGDWELGFAGDDVSFFIRFHKGGGKMLLDPEVHVPHLKLRCVSPPLQVPKETAREVSEGVAA